MYTEHVYNLGFVTLYTYIVALGQMVNVSYYIQTSSKTAAI